MSMYPEPAGHVTDCVKYLEWRRANPAWAFLHRNLQWLLWNVPEGPVTAPTLVNSHPRAERWRHPDLAARVVPWRRGNPARVGWGIFARRAASWVRVPRRPNTYYHSGTYEVLVVPPGTTLDEEDFGERYGYWTRIVWEVK
jgi:hypothetical protein